MPVSLSSTVAVYAFDMLQKGMLVRPSAEAFCTISPLPAAAAFQRTFLTSSYKERARKVKQNLKTNHTKAHLEPTPRTGTDTPVLFLMLLIVGIWDSSKGARPVNCRGVQQHLSLTAAVCRHSGFCKRR